MSGDESGSESEGGTYTLVVDVECAVAEALPAGPVDGLDGFVSGIREAHEAAIVDLGGGSVEVVAGSGAVAGSDVIDTADATR